MTEFWSKRRILPLIFIVKNRYYCTDGLNCPRQASSSGENFSVEQLSPKGSILGHFYHHFRFVHSDLLKL